MSTEGLWVDGNAIAGLLRELFGAELTVNCLGAHRVYRGAGTVVRCPVCGDIALRITSLPDRHVVQLTGSWSLDMPRT
jgi:hypothetical protein